MRLPTPSRVKTARAREFRKEPTEAEARAWKILRNRGVQGLKFRRQKVVDGFIVDFYCSDPPLAIEVDGGIHDTPGVKATDEEKSGVLQQRGIHLIRIRNEDVSRDRLEEEIKAAIA